MKPRVHKRGGGKFRVMLNEQHGINVDGEVSRNLCVGLIMDRGALQEHVRKLAAKLAMYEGAWRGHARKEKINDTRRALNWEHAAKARAGDKDD